jgi:NAD(P)-dependent dehydrogenase (short-subunit alcohol dehydrogenase family)
LPVPSRLADKVIVIIGGTSGLGLSATRACLAEGARVVAVGWEPQSVAAPASLPPETCLVLEADARKPETAEQSIELAERRLGGFDGLYHVAGGSGRRFGDGPLDQLSDNGWRETLDWNLSSLFYSYRAASRYWLGQQRGGSVLGLSSILATHPAPRHFATHAYATAKGAVQALTRSAAAYYAAANIRFNLLAPGLCDTPMARRAVEDPRIRQYAAARQPLDGGRVGQPADLDGAVVYFLSDESRFVTGQVLAVDGGWSVSDPPDDTGSPPDSVTMPHAPPPTTS